MSAFPYKNLENECIGKGMLKKYFKKTLMKRKKSKVFINGVKTDSYLSGRERKPCNALSHN